jgi:hypothetical protein
VDVESMRQVSATVAVTLNEPVEVAARADLEANPNISNPKPNAIDTCLIEPRYPGKRFR